RPGENRDYGHAAGEQPDGAVVAAVDHGSRAFPQPGPVPRLLRPAGRTTGRQRAPGPAPAADQAAGPAAYQRTGSRRPGRPAGAGPGGRLASAAPQGLPDAAAAGTAEGPRPDRRHELQPLRDLPLADRAASAEPARWVGRRSPRRPGIGQ